MILMHQFWFQDKKSSLISKSFLIDSIFNISYILTLQHSLMKIKFSQILRSSSCFPQAKIMLNKPFFVEICFQLAKMEKIFNVGWFCFWREMGKTSKSFLLILNCVSGRWQNLKIKLKYQKFAKVIEQVCCSWDPNFAH